MEPTWLDAEEVNVISKAISLLDGDDLAGLRYNLESIIINNSRPRQCHHVCDIVIGKPLCQLELLHSGLHVYVSGPSGFSVTW